MTLTFLVETLLFFLTSYIPASKSASLEQNCHIFGTTPSHLWNETDTSLEQNCHIFGTKLSHIWNRTCWLRGEESDYNTVTILNYNNTVTVLSDDETGTAVAQVRNRVHKDGKWRQNFEIIR